MSNFEDINIGTPSCDSCGRNFGGRLRCSRCSSAYYCGAACQKQHWKKHKKECPNYQETLEQQAAYVLRTLETAKKEDRPIYATTVCQVDDAGPYLEAKQQGLMATLEKVFRREADEPLRSWTRPGVVFSHTATIVVLLFRGERISGSDNYLGT